MMNIMNIGSYKAVICYDPDLELFRGEFVGLNGGADFYAADVEGLHREGKLSLKVFLDACARRGIQPRKRRSGRFNVRIDHELHAAIAAAARAEGKSLNQWVENVLKEHAHDSG
jgi:predicted HicB family RNase H-like nuclease